MMKKHTPGPWFRDGKTVYALMHAGWRKGVELFKNRFYASVQRDAECSEEEAEANARLIAAAPIGYDLAKCVLEWWEEHQFDSQSCGDGDFMNTYDDEPKFVQLAKQFIAKAECQS